MKMAKITGTVLNMGKKLCLNAKFVTSGKFKAFADLQLTNDGTLFALKVHNSDGFRTLFKRSITDEDWILVETEGSVKNSVNEYGGTALHALATSNYAFTSGQTIYWNANGDTVKLSHPNCHFADLHFLGKNLFCVVEDRSGDDSVQMIGRFNIEKPREFKVVAKSYDFYASPRLSPDGKHLVYVAWNDPNMPWDATSIHLIDLSKHSSNDVKLLPTDDKATVNYQAIQWKADGNSFYYVSDEQKFWSIYEFCLESKKSSLVASVDNKDLAEAIWNIGDDHFYAINSNYVVYCDASSLYAKCLSSGQVDTIGSPDYTFYHRLYIDNSDTVYCIASGPLEAETLVSIKINKGGKSTLRVIDRILDTSEFKSSEIEPCESIVFHVTDATTNEQVPIEGFYYPPIDEESDKKPPLIMMGHPGPTTQTFSTFDKKKLFYRSHGFAIFDVNYRGSTGYGRHFRDLLYSNWGESDVVDICEGAKHLIKLDRVDKNNIFIVGSSAGGYLVLRALYKEPHLFKAAVCSYGFFDLFALAAETHRFERAYNDHLIAPQSNKDIWNERNMADKLDKIVTPMLLYHGTDDRVVPYQQSEQIHNLLKEKGVRTQLEIFKGEGHGFRRAENIETVLNGTLKFFQDPVSLGKLKL